MSERPKKTTRCGYCEAHVTPERENAHWQRGFVSYCRHRRIRLDMQK